jgi:hypothetical protein
MAQFTSRFNIISIHTIALCFTWRIDPLSHSLLSPCSPPLAHLLNVVSCYTVGLNDVFLILTSMLGVMAYIFFRSFYLSYFFLHGAGVAFDR